MDALDLDVTAIAHGGVGVARDGQGRVVFVADAIPGERVRAVVAEAKRSFARAVAVEVLEASPDRVPHVWREASIERAPEARAGGAEFGHIALARQRALKGEVLRDALRRFGGVDDARVEAALGAGREAAGEAAGGDLETAAGAASSTGDPVSGDRAADASGAAEAVRAAPGDAETGGLGWRTRVRLHVGPDGRPGPYAARSHRVVPVASLPLAVPGIAAVLEQRFEGAERVDAIATPDGLRLVVGDQVPSVIEARVGARVLRVDDTGFWQVHREAPGVLVRAVREAIDPARFDLAARNLDLYGGVGLLASALADLGGEATRVETVESDPRASAHAAENLAALPAATATAERVDRWLRRTEPAGFDGAVVVLDPPRSGAGIGTARAIAALGATQLVYVACDPVALARDARTLEEAGYRLVRLAGFDLFPHTHHSEAVATFLRR